MRKLAGLRANPGDLAEANQTNAYLRCPSGGSGRGGQGRGEEKCCHHCHTVYIDTSGDGLAKHIASFAVMCRDRACYCIAIPTVCKHVLVSALIHLTGTLQMHDLSTTRK